MAGSNSSFLLGDADSLSFVKYFLCFALSSTVELQVVLPRRYFVSDASAWLGCLYSLPWLSKTNIPGSTFSATSLYYVIGLPNRFRCSSVGASISRLNRSRFLVTQLWDRSRAERDFKFEKELDFSSPIRLWDRFSRSSLLSCPRFSIVLIRLWERSRWDRVSDTHTRFSIRSILLFESRRTLSPLKT